MPPARQHLGAAFKTGIAWGVLSTLARLRDLAVVQACLDAEVIRVARRLSAWLVACPGATSPA